MPYLQQLGQAAGSGILGIALGGLQNEQQLNQAAKLQTLQIQGQKELTDYNYGKQLQMWKDTNYPAQVEQLKEAGLNPALLYGMGGGGGTTIGNAGTSITGQQATKSGEALAATGMALQLQLLEAQKENIQADTANKKADTANKPITGENIKTQTQSLLQGIENQKAQQQLTSIQSDLAELDKNYLNETMDARIEMVGRQVEWIIQQAKQLNYNNAVDKATINEKIKIIQQEAIAGVLKNLQTKAQTAQTEEQTKYISTDYSQRASAIMAQWESVANQHQQTANDWAEKTGMLDDMPKAAQEMIKVILGIGVLKGALTPTPNKIGFK